jgi:hypothetical protein
MDDVSKIQAHRVALIEDKLQRYIAEELSITALRDVPGCYEESDRKADNPFLCIRPKGHEGPHIAVDDLGQWTYIWEQEVV